MEQKNLTEQVSTPLETSIVQPIADTQEKQLAELQDLTRSLTHSLQAMQTQSVKNARFDDTMADLKAAARSMLVAPAIAAYPAQQAGQKGCCEDQPCGCVSSQCCCFDIVMTYVRVLAMQPLELDDSNANPWGEMEVKMFAYLDGGVGAVIPSMFSNLTLRKLIQYPGLKVGINRTIGTVCLPKGKPKTITIGVDAIEDDAGLIERATGGRDEEGSNSITMNLDCCCSSPLTASMDISFTSGGQGGGAIEVGFTAIRKS